jgi:type I restriction enzyme S subunit
VEFFIRTAKGDLERFAPSTAQKNINLETLTSVAVPLPPFEESKEITRLLTELIDGSVHMDEAVAANLADLDQLDQAILAKAFRGELVPQDPNDEPASALLARIRAHRAQQTEAAKGKRRTANNHGRDETGKKSPGPTPQQLTLAELL